MTSQSGRSANRLQFEKSPYLLQHADNPVDWYPWGDEAFTRDQIMIDGQATAYVCSDFKCQRPITDSGKLKQLIERQ